MSTRVLSKGSVNGISDVYLPDVGIIDVEYLSQLALVYQYISCSSTWP